MLQFLFLTVFGQVIDSTTKIGKPFRYVEGKDTFSVFKLSDERKIAYKISQLNDCEDNFNLAKKVIAKGDTALFKCNNEITIIKEENTNLNAQIENKNKIEETYKKDIAVKDNNIKKLNRANIFWKITSGALAMVATYFIIN